MTTKTKNKIKNITYIIGAGIICQLIPMSGWMNYYNTPSHNGDGIWYW